jgi:hypothetical protein
MNPVDLRHLESIPYELLFEITLQLDDRTLLSLCRVSRRFDALCHDETFWRQRFQQQLPHFVNTAAASIARQPTRSWRQLYSDLVQSPDLIWRLQFEYNYPDFVAAAAAEQQHRPDITHQQREQGLAYLSPGDEQFILKDTLSWEDLYTYVTRSLLLHSPKFIELYQELMEQFSGFAGPIKFFYNPYDEALTSYMPMIIFQALGPPILPIETYAQISMLLPSKAWRSVGVFRRNLPYYSSAVLIGGIGVRLDISGNVVRDEFGNGIWIPVTQQNRRLL